MNSKLHSDHYDENYFLWQKTLGEFGGIANSFKFKNSVNADDTLLDFGCGGGYLLTQLEAKKKIGIEPNLMAHSVIERNGSDVYSSSQQALSQLGNESVSVIVSNNALEHCLNPYQELKNLYALLKKNGKIHFLVPCDNPSYNWKSGDRDFHLYSWSPMNIGNLFVEVGFSNISVKRNNVKWPPGFVQIQKILGWPLFLKISRFYGLVARKWVQIEITAQKI